MPLTIERMPSYEPVDLSGACNAGVEVLGGALGDVPLGRVDLRGLPFLIGPERPSAERCFVLPGVPASVEIGRLAPRVIVAHRLLEPGAPAGHAAGRTVAEYAFHLAGGEVVTALIRERFEIQVVEAVPRLFGRLPFLAVTDTSDYNLPRSEGSWDEAGARLAEHNMGWPAGILPVVLGESSSGTSGRTDRDHPARPAVHRGWRHDQRRRRTPVRPRTCAAGAARGQGRAERRPGYRRGPGCRDLPAAAARRGRPGRLGSDRGHVRVCLGRRAAVGDRRGPAGR